jgi:hypothetical protein
MHDINKEFYKFLFNKGWTLNQIDESDIFFLFELFNEEEEKPEQVVFIDQIPGF